MCQILLLLNLLLLTVSATKTPASSCANDGTIKLTASGGASSYTYSMNGTTFVSSNTFTKLAAGTYTGYVKDARGCVGRLSNITVSKLATIAISATKTAASSCANDGAITLTASGGASPYTYSMNGTTFVSSGTFTKLAAGTYKGWVKDTRGCTQSLSNIVVSKLSTITVSATKTPASSCASDGIIKLTGSGGSSSYTYSLNGTTFVSSNTFTKLASGTYKGWVKDTRGCVQSLSNIVVAKTTFTATVSKTNVTCKGAKNGTVTISKTGGITPFTYSIDKVHFVTSNRFTNLSPGTYTATVKDAKGCTASVSGITITEPSTPCLGIIAEGSATYGNELDATVNPNPTESDFNLVVKGNIKEKVSVRIMDVYGRVIKEMSGFTYQTYRFGQEFASGTYIVEVVQGSNRKTLKIVKL